MGRFVYGFLLLAAAVTVAWYGWIEKRFSLPGLVHEVHAGIQADCFACHNEDHGIDAARCASCHRDANTGEPASFSGMASHHTDATLVCQECHIEHKGPKGNLTKKDKSLETAGCAVCHERHVGRDFQYALRAAAHPNDTIHKGHSDLASGCMACHDENSRLSNRKCIECHAEVTDQTPERSGFALHHRGKGLDCLKCHTEHRRTTTLKATAPETIKANCAECHAQHVAEGRDFKLRASDHPGRTLHAAHTRWQADCMACHTQGAGVEPAKCTVCHDPKTGEKIAFNGFSAHHADGALNCLECHLEHRGPQGRLTLASQTLKKIGCTPCHAKHMGKDHKYILPKDHHPTGSLHADHAKWQKDCTVCHDKAGGVDATKCAVCHDPKTDKIVAFQGFAAHHGFRDLKCLDCHTAHRGRDGSLLRPGKSFRSTGCVTCHARHVGPDHTYALAGKKHPEGRVHKAHAPWERDCSACHKPDGRYECLKCHDAKTGKQALIEGFGSHHFRPEMKCLDCHTEHRGQDPKPKTLFADVACATCHTSDIKAPSPLDKVPAALRGSATHFKHERHKTGKVACAECHPLKAKPVHALAGPFDRNCSSCHHGPKQKTPCATCHPKTADYFAGKYEGRLIPRGTHGKSGDVSCANCHRFEPKDNRFQDPADTCSGCHPKAYTDIFTRRRQAWHAWRDGLADAQDDPTPREVWDHSPGREALDFIGKNWYHNDAHAEPYRKAGRTKPPE